MCGSFLWCVHVSLKWWDCINISFTHSECPWLAIDLTVIFYHTCVDGHTTTAFSTHKHPKQLIHYCRVLYNLYSSSFVRGYEKRIYKHDTLVYQLFCVLVKQLNMWFTDQDLTVLITSPVFKRNKSLSYLEIFMIKLYTILHYWDCN